jgi:hypothetical protein
VNRSSAERKASFPSGYREKGWCLFPRAYPEEYRRSALGWLRRAEQEARHDPGFEAQLEEEDLDGRPVTRKLRRLLWNDPEFWAPNLEESGIFDLGRGFLGGEAAVVFHAAFLKPRRVGSPIGLHQDQGLWEHTYPGAVSLWIALTDSTPENGCLEVYSGSHREGLIVHAEDAGDRWHPTVDGRLPTLDGREPEAVPMAAGDVLVWHRHLLHGSGPNRSEHDRVGMVLVFADAGRPDFQAKDVHHLS